MPENPFTWRRDVLFGLTLIRFTTLIITRTGRRGKRFWQLVGHRAARGQDGLTVLRQASLPVLGKPQPEMEAWGRLVHCNRPLPTGRIPLATYLSGPDSVCDLNRARL